jgi:uncharacterized protein
MGLWVKISANAKKTRIVGLENEILKIKVAAPPVDGKANAELIEFLSDRLDVPKSRISIVQGEFSQKKRLQIEGLNKEDLLIRLVGGKTVEEAS